MRLGLETMQALMAALGQPNARLPSVLVAGTNGKGSTSALIESILRAAGYATGLYTSPHLEVVEERIRIGGLPIGRPLLAGLLREVIETAEAQVGHPPTYFEALTAAGILAFDRAGVDVAVLEVGLGGRLDATNVVEPRLSLITGIALDHEEHLGTSLAEIAREKAGILRSGRPALAWAQREEVRRTLKETSETRGAALEFVDQTSGARWLDEAGIGSDQRVEVRTVGGVRALTLPLAGDHQLRNLAIAVRASEVLREMGFERVSSQAIETGVATTRWPGRLETVELQTGKRVLLDTAHNPDGVESVTSYLDQLEQPFDLLFGVLRDKRVGAMLPPLARRASRMVLTKPDVARGLAVDELAAFLDEGQQAHLEGDPSAALDLALGGPGDLLLVCGSIYLVGAVRTLLRERFGVPAST